MAGPCACSRPGGEASWGAEIKQNRTFYGGLARGRAVNAVSLTLVWLHRGSRGPLGLSVGKSFARLPTTHKRRNYVVKLAKSGPKYKEKHPKTGFFNISFRKTSDDIPSPGNLTPPESHITTPEGSPIRVLYAPYSSPSYFCFISAPH